MELNTQFAVRYVTDDPVHIRDIISSLQSVETTLTETARLLPSFIDGLSVHRIDIKVREVAQESPLREAFFVAIMVTYQEQLRTEVPRLIEAATGWDVPQRFDTIVTVVALIVIFYGASALQSLVLGEGRGKLAEAQLSGLIEELSHMIGKSPTAIRKVLQDRYSEKPMWRRLINNASRFFSPSKQQDSAPIEVNSRLIDHETVVEVPAEYLVEDATENRPTRLFANTEIDLHAQDKDHTGSGWAAVVSAASEKRVRMKLMEGVSADDLWNKNRVRGDVVMIYDRVGTSLVPKEVHLHRVMESVE